MPNRKFVSGSPNIAAGGFDVRDARRARQQRLDEGLPLQRLRVARVRQRDAERLHRSPRRTRDRPTAAARSCAPAGRRRPAARPPAWSPRRSAGCACAGASDRWWCCRLLRGCASRTRRASSPATPASCRTRPTPARRSPNANPTTTASSRVWLSSGTPTDGSSDAIALVAQYASTRPAAPPARPSTQAFDQQRPHQRGAAGAHRDAHRQLAAAADRADQHQARDVDADDQQHQADRAEQHEHRLADVADHRLAQRMDRRRGVAIGARKIARQPARAIARMSSRARSSVDVRLQPADHLDVVRAALRFQVPGGEPERHPELGSQRILEACRHHADDFARDAVDRQLLADDRGIRSEAARPERVAQHHDVARAHRIVVGR